MPRPALGATILRPHQDSDKQDDRHDRDDGRPVGRAPAPRALLQQVRAQHACGASLAIRLSCRVKGGTQQTPPRVDATACPCPYVQAKAATRMSRHAWSSFRQSSTRALSSMAATRMRWHACILGLPKSAKLLDLTAPPWHELACVHLGFVPRTTHTSYTQAVVLESQHAPSCRPLVSCLGEWQCTRNLPLARPANIFQKQATPPRQHATPAACA